MATLSARFNRCLPLNCQSVDGAAPEAVFPAIRSAMVRQAEAQDAVGGPLVYAVIDDGGFRMLDGH